MQTNQRSGANLGSNEVSLALLPYINSRLGRRALCHCATATVRGDHGDGLVHGVVAGFVDGCAIHQISHVRSVG